MTFFLTVYLLIFGSLITSAVDQKVRKPPQWFIEMGPVERKVWLRYHSLSHHERYGIAPYGCDEVWDDPE